MNNEVVGITLCLENCESIYIPRNGIGDILIGNIREEICRVAINSIAKLRYCDEVFIELFPSVNAPYLSFGGMSEEPVFQRLTRFHDICTIGVHYSDGRNEKIEMPWCSAGNNNDNQSSYIGNTGHLYIGIGEDKNVENFFPKEYTEDNDVAVTYRTCCT